MLKTHSRAYTHSHKHVLANNGTSTFFYAFTLLFSMVPLFSTFFYYPNFFFYYKQFLASPEFALIKTTINLLAFSVFVVVIAIFILIFIPSQSCILFAVIVAVRSFKLLVTTKWGKKKKAEIVMQEC